MTPSDTIAIASIVANAVQGYFLYKLTHRDAASTGVREALSGVQSYIEYTRILTIPLEHEIWNYGFPSLDSFGALLANAVIATRNSPSVPRPLKDIIQDTNDRVKKLRELRDSYSLFAHGRSEEPYILQNQWPNLPMAKDRLRALRPVAKSCSEQINNFLNGS